ncbi:hypothetical protein FB45DRAFT_1022562 [Roridomyces roridus]|uniref:Uncharacterized protein n=1 Tax=Roridomyces roridus TaxID=1738132 RepID=A0AAD7C8L4_9AGAR|nr:hypothetical protein FB45DRAFT_1022562 [Roridomyces roridus]
MVPTVNAPLAVPAAAIQTAETLILMFLMDLALFGCLSVQTYVYYQAFPKDRQLTKGLVYGMYVLQLVVTAAVVHDAYTIYGSGFANLSSVTTNHVVPYIVPIIGGLSAFATQSFYACRIHILSEKQLFPSLIVVISITSCISAIVFGAFDSQISTVLGLQNSRNLVLAGIWCGGSAVADVFIAGWMTYYVNLFFPYHAII